MKKQTIILSLLMLVCSGLVEAQDTISTYFDHNWKECDMELATYYRKAYPAPSGMWIVEDYHMNGQLQMKGTYSDKQLKKQQGPAIFYHYNGNVSMTGQYVNNIAVGLWKYYFTNGSISLVGKFNNGKADSIWTGYTLKGTIFSRINYVNGKADGTSKWYYDSGKLCELATYKQDKLVTKINYDENGGVLKNTEKDRSIKFIGEEKNMTSFLQKNIKYPEELLLKEEEGIVLIHFIVHKDGKIDTVELKKSDEPLFNEEALRVFSLIKEVRPAFSHGRIIETEHTLPIVFKLTNNW